MAQKQPSLTELAKGTPYEALCTPSRLAKMPQKIRDELIDAFADFHIRRMMLEKRPGHESEVIRKVILIPPGTSQNGALFFSRGQAVGVLGNIHRL